MVTLLSSAKLISVAAEQLECHDVTRDFPTAAEQVILEFQRSRGLSHGFTSISVAAEGQPADDHFGTDTQARGGTQEDLRQSSEVSGQSTFFDKPMSANSRDRAIGTPRYSLSEIAAH
jgi:hypothetical protein